MLSHRNLADVVARLNAIMAPTTDIREYIGVPVTYSFGLGRARAVAAAGGASYIPQQFNPAEIREMLERDEINAISAVPSLWRVLLRAEHLLAGLSHKVRWIEIGSQLMSADEKAAMKRLFPEACIVQHYGLTEASRSTFLNISETDEANLLDSVGVATGKVEVRINEEGAICLRGDHVALGRLQPDGALTGLTEPEGWLVTKDQGELRDGHLYFQGRLDDQINISGIKVSADQIEQGVAAQVTGQEGRFAVAAVADHMRGNIALLAITAQAQAQAQALEDAARQTLEHYGVSGADSLRVMTVDALPRTGSGKIRRAALRELYQKDAPPEPASAPSGGWLAKLGLSRKGTDMTVRDVFMAHFPGAAIDSSTSFETLGGDSLSYLSVALDLEKIMGDLPDDWPALRISELEKLDKSTGFIGRIDTTTLRAGMDGANQPRFARQWKNAAV